jgi:pimeloyl-ACP methyl ester carboxylesterase
MRMRVSGKTTAFLVISCLLAATGVLSGAKKSAGDRSSGPLMIAKQGFFYAGGRQFAEQNQSVTVDQMFVEYQIPAKVTARYPIVMIHGNFQNGSNFLGTPDDREGWAEYFLRIGYAVYVVDQPARGRSAYNAAADGPLATDSAETIERLFTAPERFNAWSQAHLHTEWPGSGMAGDPVFEQFRASQNPSLTNDTVMDGANRAAAVALLRRTGPAVIMTHSRSGSFGWEIGDDAPELVKGIIAVEPSGPPFYNASPLAAGAPGLVRPWGVSYDHLTYDPPVKEASDLAPKQQEKPEGPELEPCWFAGTPHKLPHLAGIPIMIMASEASFHSRYDHCTAQFLKQAGVPNDLVLLGDHGIHGNGHMMMLEKNNLEIAGLIADWISQHVK